MQKKRDFIWTKHSLREPCNLEGFLHAKDGTHGHRIPAVTF